MQIKRKKLYCMLLTICFIASCICLNDFKTGNLMPLFGATNQASQVIATDYHIANEDVCTADMLGNTHTSLLNQQRVTRNTDILRKIRTILYWLDDFRSLQIPFKFFTSTNPNICNIAVDVTDIIHFIHDKDGKKRN